MDPLAFCEQLQNIRIHHEPDPSWSAAWIEAGKNAETALGPKLEPARAKLSEPVVARAITRLIPDDSILVAGSSMPIRDLSVFRCASQFNGNLVMANRGASGIDGTVATAAGLAFASGRRVSVMLGDLALLHDINSLALIRMLPVTIVVINNNGGGIFHLLPIPRSDETIERCFGTPHGLHFGQQQSCSAWSTTAPVFGRVRDDL